MNPIPIPTSKRVFDIFVSFILLFLLSPIFIVFIVIFIVEQIFIPSSRGPFFYKEIRISQGRPFVFSKIRTFKIKAIKEAAAKSEVIHTKDLESDKNNLTLMGTMLRQIYMDELPQIFSVLIGDMSLVGPRPTNTFNYEMDLQNGLSARKIMIAGLTGKFQAHKNVKYKLDQEKVDMEYAELCKNASGIRIIFYDIHILFQTLIAVLRAEGL